MRGLIEGLPPAIAFILILVSIFFVVLFLFLPFYISSIRSILLKQNELIGSIKEIMVGKPR